MDLGGSWELRRSKKYSNTLERNAHSQWVTAYKLQYSEDGANFYYFKATRKSTSKVNVESVNCF